MKNVFALIAVMLICFVGVSKGSAPPGPELTRHVMPEFVIDAQQADVAIMVESFTLDAPFELYVLPAIAADVHQAEVAFVLAQNDVPDVPDFCNIPTPSARNAVINDVEKLQVFSCTINRSVLKSEVIRSLNPFSGYWQHFY